MGSHQLGIREYTACEVTKLGFSDMQLAYDDGEHDR